MKKVQMTLTEEIQVLVERIEAQYGYLHRSFKSTIVNATFENRTDELVQIKWLLMQILETSQQKAA